MWEARTAPSGPRPFVDMSNPFGEVKDMRRPGWRGLEVLFFPLDLC